MLAIFNAPLLSLEKVKRTKTSSVNGPNGKVRVMVVYRSGVREPIDKHLGVESTCLNSDEPGMPSDVCVVHLEEGWSVPSEIRVAMQWSPDLGGLYESEQSGR